MGGFGINRYITYSVTKIIQTCLPRIGQFFDTMIVASTDKEW